MTDAPIPRRWFSDRLNFRVAFLLASVLLPLTLISGFATTNLLVQTKARAEAALQGETLLAASTEQQAIQKAIGTTQSLASIIGALLSDPARCSQAMSSLVDADPDLTFAAFVPNNGMITCSSQPSAIDVSDNPYFKKIVTETRTSVNVMLDGPITRQPFIPVSAPVLDASNQQIGYVSVSLPHSTFDTSRLAEPGLRLLTFGQDGTVLTSTTGLANAEEVLPINRAMPLLANPKPFTFNDFGRNGEELVYAVVPLVEDQVYALGIRRASEAQSALPAIFSAPLLLPALTWLASFVIAWLAVEHLVIRHVRNLSASMRSFAQGARIIKDIDMKDAALEIREIGEAYAALTDNVIRSEAELEDTVHQREVLLREVHHRVKNNLQLIASIMNMQIRRETSQSGREKLRALQDRVLSLASVHRELFQTSGVADIQADELLNSILTQLANRNAPEAGAVIIHRDIDKVRMAPDQAVPTALLLTEAMNTALKHSPSATEEKPVINVTFKRAADRKMTLAVCNSTTLDEIGDDDCADKGSLGAQLMSGFARQLGGKLDRDVHEGRYRLSVTFPLQELAQGEQRKQQTTFTIRREPVDNRMR